MPGSRRDSDDEVRRAFAARLGVAADASLDDCTAALDKRLHEERMVGAIAQKLDLDPFSDELGAEIIAEVGKRLDVRAKAAGLQAGAKLPEIAAAEAAKLQETSPASASDGNESVQRTLAEIRDRLAHVPTTEEQQAAEEDAAVGALLRGRYTTTNGRVVGEESSADQSSAWR